MYERKDIPSLDVPHRLDTARNGAHPYSARMTALAESFPSLRNMPGVSPWRPELLARRIGTMSHGEACAAQFVLSVWSGGKYPRIRAFDLFEAMRVWDREHTEAAAAWMRASFWP